MFAPAYMGRKRCVQMLFTRFQHGSFWTLRRTRISSCATLDRAACSGFLRRNKYPQFLFSCHRSSGAPYLAKNERETPNFLYAALDATARAPFCKESRMKSAEPNKLNRKSGIWAHPTIYGREKDPQTIPFHPSVGRRSRWFGQLWVERIAYHQPWGVMKQ